MIYRQGDLKAGGSRSPWLRHGTQRGTFEACGYTIDTNNRSLPLRENAMWKGGNQAWVKGTRIQP
ncbi:MAG TPA: hypothetical protein VLX33_00850 [Nitrososphaerales archaeon]|nr:hypothetical protein [Nitrososphaerales archaeon]